LQIGQDARWEHSMAAQDHPTFEKPADPAIKIWRYIGLTKFLWMLQRGALYFSRSDLMGDPFEGHYSKITALSEDSFVAAQMTNPIFAEMGEPVHRRNFRKIIANVKTEKLGLFVNCWHMNESESWAMWKLYASQDEAICIQSTFSTLRQLLPDNAFLGTVKYIDYDREYINITDAFQYIVHKRKSFEHERELRAVIWKHLSEGIGRVGDGGMIVPIDLNHLVSNIFISPSATSMFDEVVRGLVSSYKLDAPVHHSRVNEGPDY
jgi:hypothetical protein